MYQYLWPLQYISNEATIQNKAHKHKQNQHSYKHDTPSQYLLSSSVDHLLLLFLIYLIRFIRKTVKRILVFLFVIMFFVDHRVVHCVLQIRMTKCYIANLKEKKKMKIAKKSHEKVTRTCASHTHKHTHTQRRRQLTTSTKIVAS